MEVTRVYGWKRDKNDHRDHKLRLTMKNIELPSKVDLREEFTFPEPYDQGSLGSCTANAIGFAYQYDEIIQNNSSCFMPSRLFIYYNERKMEGTIHEDSGAEIRDGIKSINTHGVCKETLWPYTIDKFTLTPTQECYDEGRKCQAVSYSRVEQDIYSIKTMIHNKRPIVFGFMVYESFESKEVSKTGMMTLPKPKKEKCCGGHAVICIGYSDEIDFKDGSKGAFIIRNSWGPDWGDKGYFYMPYKFLLNPDLASDFWVVHQVTDPILKLYHIDKPVQVTTRIDA